MQKNCSPKEFSLKSFFLAPRAENKELFYDMTHLIFKDWITWRKTQFEKDGFLIPEKEKNHKLYKENITNMIAGVQKISNQFNKEIPRHSPHYIGHMYSEFSLPALLGHMLALLYNPNNISTESSLVGVKLEREAIQTLAKMIGYSKKSRGHFTSGGTIANIEMLYRARKLFEIDGRSSKSDPVLLIPEGAHYSWKKGSELIGLKKNQLIFLKLNKNGAIDFNAFKKVVNQLISQKIPILGAISIFGSTELGIIDPIDQIAFFLKKIKKEKNIFIWHHVDAAYGGYFTTMKSLLKKESHFYKNIVALKYSDSITIDPHKLGFVPYSSGCFLCNDPKLYLSVNTSAPYVDFKSELEPGPYTIEGSRSAAGALATLLSSKSIGFNKDGFGLLLKRSIKNSHLMRKHLKNNPHIIVIEPISTNIVCFLIKGKSLKLSDCNKLTKHVLKNIETHNKKSQNTFYVSKTTLSNGHKDLIENICVKNKIQANIKEMFLIRCTIMNPFINSRYSNNNIILDFCSHIDKML